MSTIKISSQATAAARAVVNAYTDTNKTTARRVALVLDLDTAANDAATFKSAMAAAIAEFDTVLAKNGAARIVNLPSIPVLYKLRDAGRMAASLSLLANDDATTALVRLVNDAGRYAKGMERLKTVAEEWATIPVSERAAHIIANAKDIGDSLKSAGKSAKVNNATPANKSVTTPASVNSVSADLLSDIAKIAKRISSSKNLTPADKLKIYTALAAAAVPLKVSTQATTTQAATTTDERADKAARKAMRKEERKIREMNESRI
jgi:hypothetical protein